MQKISIVEIGKGEEVLAQIAEVVRGAREHAALSRSQLARKIGVSTKSLEGLETMQSPRLATTDTLAKVAHACGGEFEFGFRPDRRQTVNR